MADLQRLEEVEELPSGLLDDLKDGGMTYEQFEENYDWSDDRVRDEYERMQEIGIPIEKEQINQHGKLNYKIDIDAESNNQAFWETDDGWYAFGLISDTHLGCKREYLDELEDFYDKVEDHPADIDKVFHAGDIGDGAGENHRGHRNAMKPEAIGWGNQIDYIVENFPEREGIDTYFITGNHDDKMFKDTAIRLGEQVDDRRDDLHWLGENWARINMPDAEGEDEISMELIHPSGGVPYTLGYRAQTQLRDRGGEKPDIAVFGHMHKILTGEYDGTKIVYPGAWQGPSPYLDRKGTPNPRAGGFIMNYKAEDGHIDRWQTELVEYDVDDAASRSIDFSDLEGEERELKTEVEDVLE